MVTFPPCTPLSPLRNHLKANTGPNGCAERARGRAEARVLCEAVPEADAQWPVLHSRTSSRRSPPTLSPSLPLSPRLTAVGSSGMFVRHISLQTGPEARVGTAAAAAPLRARGTRSPRQRSQDSSQTRRLCSRGRRWKCWSIFAHARCNRSGLCSWSNRWRCLRSWVNQVISVIALNPNTFPSFVSRCVSYS